MPITFRIFPRQNLVYVRYEGFACTEETMQVFAEVAGHPDSLPSQNHLVDLSKITDFDRSFVGMMHIQARQADHFLRSENDPILIFYAPTELGQRMGSRVLASWRELGGVVPMVISDLDEALNVLGLEPSIMHDVNLAFA